MNKKTVLALVAGMVLVTGNAMAAHDGKGGHGQEQMAAQPAVDGGVPAATDATLPCDEECEKKRKREHKHDGKGADDQPGDRKPDCDRERDRDCDQARERRVEGEANRGQDKQAGKKATQERKEAGKGSEQGQQMRQEHSRKWWKFWD